MVVGVRFFNQPQAWKQEKKLHPLSSFFICCILCPLFLPVVVWHSWLQELCAGFEVLEETLVLRVEGGAEHYVPVSGRYASQAFGAPLEQLSARHGSQVCTAAGVLAVRYVSTAALFLPCGVCACVAVDSTVSYVLFPQQGTANGHHTAVGAVQGKVPVVHGDYDSSSCVRCGRGVFTRWDACQDMLLSASSPAELGRILYDAFCVDHGIRFFIFWISTGYVVWRYCAEAEQIVF